MAGVRYHHVYKVYDNGVVAVQDFDFEIRDGEFLILVGPSGCGKSTTLRMLAGLEDVSQGDIWIGNTKITDLAPRDRDIAMVFQNYALYPHLSVRDNMGFSLKLRKVPPAEITQKVVEAAGILALEKLLDRKPKELSGGQRQRVAMGRAIVRSPKVFLFDEPLSNLDAKLRVEMRVEIAKLHKKLKTTIVYVTHDQIEAMTLADRIVVMKDGTIHQVGTPLEIYERPVNSFVAGFIGTPPMNQLAARLERQNGELALAGKDYCLPLPTPTASQLAAMEGQAVIWGLRPEHIALQGSAGSHKLETLLEVVEPMGSESYVYFTLDQRQCVMRITGLLPIQEGQKAQIYLDGSKIHLFTADGKKRLA